MARGRKKDDDEHALPARTDQWGLGRKAVEIPSQRALEAMEPGKLLEIAKAHHVQGQAIYEREVLPYAVVVGLCLREAKEKVQRRDGQSWTRYLEREWPAFGETTSRKFIGTAETYLQLVSAHPGAGNLKQVMSTMAQAAKAIGCAELAKPAAREPRKPAPPPPPPAPDPVLDAEYEVLEQEAADQEQADLELIEAQDAADQAAADALAQTLDGSPTPCAKCGEEIPRSWDYCLTDTSTGDLVFKHPSCLHPTDAPIARERAASPVEGAEPACACGHVQDEHGGDPEFPGSTSCRVDACECLMFEADGPDDQEDELPAHPEGDDEGDPDEGDAPLAQPSERVLELTRQAAERVREESCVSPEEREQALGAFHLDPSDVASIATLLFACDPDEILVRAAGFLPGGPGLEHKHFARLWAVVEDLREDAQQILPGQSPAQRARMKRLRAALEPVLELAQQLAYGEEPDEEPILEAPSREWPSEADVAAARDQLAREPLNVEAVITLIYREKWLFPAVLSEEIGPSVHLLQWVRALYHEAWRVTAAKVGDLAGSKRRLPAAVVAEAQGCVAELRQVVAKLAEFVKERCPSPAPEIAREGKRLGEARKKARDGRAKKKGAKA